MLLGDMRRQTILTRWNSVELGPHIAASGETSYGFDLAQLYKATQIRVSQHLLQEPGQL
jgi:hypothetical protein